MRTMLLLGTTTIVLALGGVGAQALPLGNQTAAPSAAFNEQFLTADSGTLAVAGRSAFANDASGRAPVAEPAEVDPTLPIDKDPAVRNFVLLAIAAAIAGFAAVSAIASRIMDGQEFSPGGVADQPPEGLLRANLANLDGLIVGHCDHGT